MYCDNVVHVNCYHYILMHYHLCDITCGKLLGYCETPNHIDVKTTGAYKENHYAQYSKENRRAQK